MEYFPSYVNDDDVSRTSHDNGADGFAIGVIAIFLGSNIFDLALDRCCFLRSDLLIDPTRYVMTFSCLVQICTS